MNLILLVSLLPLIIELNQFPFVSSTGSKTFETTNGFPINFLNDILTSDVVKRKTTSRWKWEVWDVVPGTHAYQIYVFNITNPVEVNQGGKPILQQVGPYYYKEYRYKFGVSMNLDLSVNFERNFTYTFDPDHSNGKETDVVNVINTPLLIFSTLASKHSPSLAEANRAVSDLVASGETLVKRNVKIGDLLFNGMDVSKYEKYLNLLGPSTWLKDEFEEGRYGVLKLKNGVHEGAFTVNSGLKDESKVGKIITYNEGEKLSYWEGDRCNAIKGSDGSVFPPHLDTSSKINMLEVDLCRSIDFEYTEEMPFKKVVGHVYTIGKDVFEDPEVNKENECFCVHQKSTSGDGCLKKGVLDVSSCQFGAPYVMSHAHFVDASEEYLEGVVGLKPDPKLHKTQVTVEPVTGAVITFHKRYQWNIWIKPLAGLDYFSKFKSQLVPVLWNDDVFTLDSDKEELLMEELASQQGGMGYSKANQLSYGVLSLFMVITIAVFLL